MNLGHVFAASTRRTPDHVAVIEGDLRMTYAEWYGVIRAVAGA
jgi:2-furoate---CoA ligase